MTCAVCKLLPAGAVQIHAVNLRQHWRGCAVGAIPQLAGGFINLHNVDHGARMSRQWLHELRVGKFSKFQIIEAALLTAPHKAVAVGKKLQKRMIVLPCVLRLIHNHARGAGGWIGGDQIQRILPAIGAKIQKLIVVAPANAVNILIALITNIHRNHATSRHFKHHQTCDGIRVAWLGVPHWRVGGAQRVPAFEQFIFGHLRIIEGVEGQKLSVIAPPHGVALIQFFSVHPIGGAVLNVLARLHFHHGLLRFCFYVFQIHATVAVDGFGISIRTCGLRALLGAARRRIFWPLGFIRHGRVAFRLA